MDFLSWLKALDINKPAHAAAIGIVGALSKTEQTISTLTAASPIVTGIAQAALAASGAAPEVDAITTLAEDALSVAKNLANATAEAATTGSPSAAPPASGH